MAVLSDRGILEAIENKRFSIEPKLNLNRLQPSSIDLTLHHTIKVFSGSEPLRADISKDELQKRMLEMNISDGYMLQPGCMVAAFSAEKITLSPYLCGMLLNRNSLAMFGIDATLSAYANPGYSGRKSIVIRNGGPAPVVLEPGMSICQLVLCELGSPSVRTYQNRHDVDMLREFVKNKHSFETEAPKIGRRTFAEFFNEQLALISGRS